MKRIIISDSCLELNDKLKDKLDLIKIPVNLDLGEEYIKDDDNLNIEEFVRKMHAYKGVPKTAAPSPQAFYDAMQGYDEVFIVSITSKLSTTFNSALIAKQMMEEDHPEVKVHVFDTKSAVSGETLIAIEIDKLLDEKAPFETIVDKIEAKIKSMKTLFVLENLDNLVKNGRMSKIAGKLASALSINPLCEANEGEIQVVSKARGMKSGLNKLVSYMAEGIDDISSRKIVISHVLNEARALDLKQKIKDVYNAHDIEIVSSSGITAIYANEGGIVVAL